MKVLFKRGWFSPAGSRVKQSRGSWDTREVADHLLPFLPKDAKIVEGPVVAKPVEKAETLRDHDADRASAEDAARKLAEAEAAEAAAEAAADSIEAAAEAERAAKRQALADQIAAEAKGTKKKGR